MPWRLLDAHALEDAEANFDRPRVDDGRAQIDGRVDAHCIPVLAQLLLPQLLLRLVVGLRGGSALHDERAEAALTHAPGEQRVKNGRRTRALRTRGTGLDPQTR